MFPYYQNYVDLCRLETSVLEAFLPQKCPQPKRIAFIGSGPLPLTTVCLLDRYPNAVVHNIDRDNKVLESSKLLAHRLGYAHRMTFSCEDVSKLDISGVKADARYTLASGTECLPPPYLWKATTVAFTWELEHSSPRLC